MVRVNGGAGGGFTAASSGAMRLCGSRTSQPDGSGGSAAISRSRVGTRAQGSVTGRIAVRSCPPAMRISAQRAQKAAMQSGSKWRPLSARRLSRAASKGIAAL